MNAKLSFLVSATTMVISSWALADLKFEQNMVARSHITDGFELPAMSFLNNTYPQINNRGDIAFKVSAVDGTGVQGIWFKAANQHGKFIHVEKEGYYLTEPHMNEKSQVVFSNTDELSSEGIYLYDLNTDQKSLIYDASKTNFAYTSTPMVVADGSIYFRGTTKDGERALHVQDGKSKGSLETFLTEGTKNFDLPVSYVFYPSVNETNLIAVKVRMGEMGEIGNQQPDSILLIKKSKDIKTQQDKYVVLDRVTDVKGDPLSPFKILGNGVKIASDGSISFFAFLLDGKTKVVVVHKNGKSKIIATAGQDGISDIESFTPVTNSQGMTVFRALDRKGLSSIYVHYKGQLQRYIGEGDSIQTDLGTHNILFADGHTGLHGAPAINDNNEFVFATTLEHFKTGDEIGNAVFKIKLVD